MRGRPDLAAVPPPPSSKARVLVVDDHALIREGLAHLINRQSDLTCCGCTENIHAALQALADHPDVALVDLCLGLEDGLELVKLLRAASPALRILILSQLDETVYGERAFHAGADGYVMKEQAANAILRAIRKVLAGQTHFHSQFAPAALGQTSAPSGFQLAPLTDRERQVLESVASGLTNTQIAADLQLSLAAFETCRQQLQQKLGFASTAEFVRYAGRWVRHQLKPHASRAH